MDRRLLKSNGRVAHVALRGQVAAAAFAEPVPLRVALPVAGLYSLPEGAPPRRERELVLHEVFEALEIGETWVFGAAARDGYVGYIRRAALAEAAPIRPTHVVAARQSYLAPVPVLKNSEEMLPISFGTALELGATHESGRWAEVAQLRAAPEGHKTSYTAYVPMAHLRPLAQAEADPVAVAERFLGVPYHWGGNSGFGIDCSGLVQAACLACAIPCPGDSDLQEAALGRTLPPDAALQRGDLLFWKGHVAWVAGPDLLLHANAHHMAVAREPLAAALARIEAQGDGQVTRRARLAPGG
ncbi:MAG: NlpC/P60 family protein [Rhodobacteraceae bacterium]|nr:MAG: NlpC/P60 family protein [Paracoccaceae bacterium]